MSRNFGHFDICPRRHTTPAVPCLWCAGYTVGRVADLAQLTRREPAHVDRRKCSVCKGTGAILADMLVPAPRTPETAEPTEAEPRAPAWDPEAAQRRFTESERSIAPSGPAEAEPSAPVEMVPRDGVLTWGKRSDGVWGCDHCCNGDRCDEPAHVDRRQCSVCKGTGAIPGDMLVPAPRTPVDERIVCPLSNATLGSDNRCRVCRFVGRGHIVEADYFRVSCHMIASAPSSSIVNGATWRADWGASLRTESMVAASHVERTQYNRRGKCTYVPEQIGESFEYARVRLSTMFGVRAGGGDSC